MNLTGLILAQLPDRIEGIKNRFAQGSTFAEIFLAVAVVMAVLLILWTILSGIQARQRRPVSNPGSLFRTIMRQLPLTVQQRNFLARIARDLRLEHPTVLLLSPQVFRNHANRWMSLTRNANTPTQQRIAQIASAMFPDTGNLSVPEADAFVH